MVVLLESLVQLHLTYLLLLKNLWNLAIRNWKEVWKFLFLPPIPLTNSLNSLPSSKIF